MPASRVACVLAIGAFLFVLGRSATLILPHASVPRVEITPATLDLGEVAVGQTIARSVSIRNSGSGRLLITDVKSTCQCTVAELPTRVVQRGESVDLQVTFQARIAGPRSQSVTVRTNDPETPAQVIRLKALAVATTRP